MHNEQLARQLQEVEASPDKPLDALRERAIRSARIRLSSLYELESTDPGEVYVEAWKLKTDVGVSDSLHVKIPKRFPLVLPHIFIDRRDLFGVISHINRAGQFCYLEQDAVAYEVDKIADVVEEAVARTISALRDDDRLRDSDEFRKELFAYLGTKGPFLSLLEGFDTPRLVSLTALDENCAGYKFVVSESEDQSKRWLERSGIAKAENSSTAMFIPEAIVGQPPFASTLKELAALLKANSPEHFAFFVKCFRLVDTCITTVTSSLGSSIVAYKFIRSRFADPGRSPKVPGFRPGKYPRETELGSGFADTPVEYFEGQRVDLERLVGRTEPSVLTECDRRIVIVGLGALGSHIAKMLPKAAICSKVTLFDKERLGVENVLRHASHFGFVGYSKSLVVQFESRPHAPWTDYESYKDVLLEIEEFERVCKEATVIILATGSERLDSFLSEVAYSRLSDGGVVAQVWLEERADSGNIVCYVKGRGACPSCGHVTRKTIDLSSGTQEPGCNASYANYGGSRLQRFCAIALDYMIHAKGTCAVTWIARNGDDPFSADACRVSALEPGECELCGG